jgi:YD repeat-containing protein
VTCTAELKKGCRALSFAYATKTTASGEASSEWGEYNGRLKTVSFTAYNPSSKAMETKTVAEYSYDKQGRLRAEWDPRVSPTLKTTYGYDAEGHVVAVNPSGQEPSLLHYGTTAGDPSAGRLLSITRPPASTQAELKTANERPAPVNTASPTLSSTSPVIGTTLSISSNGTWSNSPSIYSDSWQDCYTYESKETCTAISGAVNSTYTPQARDAGYTLKAQITAVNADGASSASTAASKALALSAPSYLRKFGEAGENEKGQFKGSAAAAVDASGDVWVIDHGNARVEEWSSTGTWLHTYGKKGSGSLQFESPEGIAINQGTGNVYVADKGNNRIEELNSKGEYVGTFGGKGAGPGQLNSPDGVAVEPSGNVWVGDYGNNRVDEFSETGEYLGSFGIEGSGNGQFKGPDGIAFSGGNAYVVDDGNDRVQEFSMSGEFISKFGSKGSGEGQFETPYGISTEPVSGDLYVGDYANNRVEEFNPAGTFLVAFGKKGEANGEFIGPQSIAVNSTGDVYVSDSGNNRVQEFEPKYSTSNPLPEPPVLGTSAVSTIDYNVPVSGSGAPYEMTKTELEKWSQSDDPTEATAVFPPDEPMGWPAKDYKRATVTYLDELGRTVNHASPPGAISTSEYNETNEVIRSLSADNRAAALKESKSKEVSTQLDTQSKYNAEGTELESTLGPQHMIKLASGIEKQARNHVKYYYNEGAPKGETYDLVTKSTDGAEYEGKESDLRTTTTSYSGQNNLGWLLRKPTSVTADPNNAFNDVFKAAFGNTGPGNGQFKEPHGVAVTSNGDVYVVDTVNNRVQEFSSSDEYLTQFGSEGTGNGQFKEPEGVAVAPNGDIYVADTANNRVQEFNEKGGYLRQFGQEGVEERRLRGPAGLAVASNGDVYVVDDAGSERADQVYEFNEEGTFIRKFAEHETSTTCETETGGVKNPHGVAVASNGNVYVTNTGGNCVEEFGEKGEYIRLFGEEGYGKGQFKEPTGILTIADGDVYIADTGNNRVQVFNEKGRYIGQFGSYGSGNGQFIHPTGLAVASSGDVYVADTVNNRVERWGGPSSGLNLIHTTVYDHLTGKVLETRSPAAGEGKEEGSSGYAFKTVFGSLGTGQRQFNGPRGVAVAPNGSVYVTDYGNDRVQEFSASGEYLMQFGSLGTGNGQFKEPRGIAVTSNGKVYVADSGNSRVQEFSAAGEYLAQFGTPGTGNGQFVHPRGLAFASNGNVYVTDSGNNRVQEFSASGEYLAQFGTTGGGNGTFRDPVGVAIASNGDVYVVDSGNDRVEEFSASGEYLAQFGTYEGSGGGPQFQEPGGVATASNGNVYVVDASLDRVQEVSSSGKLLGQFGQEGSENGQLEEPWDVAMAPNGNIYVADTGNNRVEMWTSPASASVSQTIYYTSQANSTYPSCGEHPEWAELPCQAQPAAQPGTTGLPELPVVTDTYNMWDEPETVTEKFGSATRTKQMTYDSAGRLLTNEETSTIDTSLPKVTDEYNPETGAMIKQSTTTGETTKTIKNVYNTLGELTEYIDADGNKSTYTYTHDGQVEEMSDGKGTQIYAYDPTTEALTKLLDSAAGTFIASYDVEGKMTSEGYPNGMSAKYTLNSTGETTGIEYEKTTYCTSSCTWFKETLVPSIHGEALSRSSTLASEEYTYDAVGRLTQVQETPAGRGCKTRIYAYNEDSDRTSLTTREPKLSEKCATTGGTTENHSYDTADRLADTGVVYDSLGNQTKVPAGDAGGHEITATFYVSNQTRSQTQNSETLTYNTDPSGRTREIVSTGTTNSTVINHYPGPGDALSWASEGGEIWTRNIPGIDGSLSATQKNGAAAVLQLHDLQGNIVATAALSETETKLLTTYNSTEYGVPVNGTPPKYSWLGASGQATELPSGATTSGGSGYVPQLGQPLQTQPIIPPGAAPNGTYISPYTSTLTPGAYAASAVFAAGATGREATRQREAQEQWEREHPPTPPGATPTPGEPEGPLGGSEGWACKYAAETGQPGEGCFNSFFFEQFQVTGGVEGAVDASSILSSLKGILKGGVEGAEIGWGALESAGRFVGRNSGRFLAIMHDVSSGAEALLALQLGGAACVVGAVVATAEAPYAAPFVWFGCASFIFGNAALVGWSAYDLYKNASHIH